VRSRPLPVPFADSSFDGLQAVHVIEHLADVIRAMEEFHRLVRAGAVSSGHPALHRLQLLLRSHPPLHLNSFSFRYFGSATAGSATIPAPDSGRFPSTSSYCFLEDARLEFLVNRFRRFRLFWEHYCCYVVRGKVLEFEFE